MSAGAIGLIAVWAAIGLAVIALITGRRWALMSSLIATTAATAVLAYALVTSDFSLSYVTETTSLSTPWPYRVAAIWGGMDGSMLFYTLLVVAIGALVLKTAATVRVVAAAGVSLLLITVLFANPFTVLQIPAVDGGGLLAILQHPAMVYHPPILYLGLACLIVPFALTVDHAFAGLGRVSWLRETRRWMYVSWTLLALGMVAGSNWAYVELGWGGFWAWDPVENTALMPWIATTVLLHSSRIEESTGRWRRWNVVFAGMPFALTVMGVYLTRSGATGSIHSFAEDPVVGRVLLAAAALVGSFVILLALRTERGEPWGRFRLDRDGWLATNGILLSAALVFVTAGSGYPAFASVFGGGDVTVDSHFFAVTMLPLAVAVAVSLALALRRSWVTYAVGLAVASVAALTVVGTRVGVLLMVPALASLGVIVLGMTRARVGRRLLTAYLAHLGLAVLLVGVAGSSFGDEHSGSMVPGDTISVAGHELTLRDIQTGEDDRFVFVRGVFDLDGAVISPEIRAYEEQGTPVSEPVVRPGVVDDVIVAISLLFPDANTVEVSVFVRPLVSAVWLGAILMGMAGLIALVSRDGAAGGRRRTAREARQSGETTSEIASR